MAKQTDLTFQPNGQANQPVKPVRSDPAPLQPGSIYHIYNRGVNRETIFHEKRNYEYFINLYARHIQPMADTFAFCLLPNHFHLLIEVRQNLTGLGDLSGLKPPARHFPTYSTPMPKPSTKVISAPGQYLNDHSNEFR